MGNKGRVSVTTKVLLTLLLCIVTLQAFSYASPTTQHNNDNEKMSIFGTANAGSGSSTESHSNNQQDANKVILMFLLMVSGAVMVVYVIVSLKVPFIPESIAIVVYGIIIGIIVRNTNSDLVKQVATFDPETFFLFILPTIIFETGFSLPKTDFFKHIVGILLFAVFGTLISFVITGGGVYLTGRMGISLALPAKDAFAFGAMTSATDPVATLAIFQALNVDSTLYMLVLGESILNDATALMIYRSVINFEPSKLWLNCIDFLLIALGSVGLGIGMAIVLSLMLKFINIGRFPALETIFMIVFSYMSYVLANSLDISGILAVFFCGITFNQYGAYSLSPYTKLTSRQLFRTAAFICETCVFIYMGISSSFHEFTFHFGLFAWSIVFICLSRAVAIFAICYLLNKFLKNKIEKSIQVALWFAGLRGAIAFSLSLDYESPYASYIRTDTLLVVIFTLFIFGIGTYPLLKGLGIKTSNTDQSLDNITKVMNKKSKTKDRTAMYQSFDDKYLKRWLRKKVPPLANDAIEIFEKLVQSSNEQDISTFESPKYEMAQHQFDDVSTPPNLTLNNHQNNNNNNNNNNNDHPLQIIHDDHHFHDHHDDLNSPLIFTK